MQERVNVDWSTGLPEVPENYFWRVERSLQNVPASGEYQGRMMRPQSGGVAGWENRNVGFVSLMHRERVFKYKWLRESYTDCDVVVSGLMICHETRSESNNMIMRDYSITPGSIRRTADLVMVKWGAIKQAEFRQRAEDDLIGDYPPKKLR
jgi:hypothetical protein